MQNEEFIIGVRVYNDRELTLCGVLIDTGKLKKQSSDRTDNIATTILMFAGISEKEAQDLSGDFAKVFLKENVLNDYGDIFIYLNSVDAWIRKNISAAKRREVLPCGKFLISFEVVVPSRDNKMVLENERGTRVFTVDFPMTLDELFYEYLELGEVASYYVEKFQKI